MDKPTRNLGVALSWKKINPRTAFITKANPPHNVLVTETGAIWLARNAKDIPSVFAPMVAASCKEVTKVFNTTKIIGKMNGAWRLMDWSGVIRLGEEASVEGEIVNNSMHFS